MWSGWLSAIAAIAAIVLIWSALNIDGDANDSYVAIFIPIWILVGAFYWSSLAPCADGRAACTSPATSAYTAAEIAAAKQRLADQVWMILVSFAATSLFLAACILLAMQLDGDTTSWLPFFAVLWSCIGLVIVYSGIVTCCIAYRSGGGVATVMFACCRTPNIPSPSDIQQVTRKQYRDDLADVPVWVYGYDERHEYGYWYPIVLYVMYIAYVVASILLYLYLEFASVTLAQVLIPVWIGLGLGVVSSVGALIQESRSSQTDAYNVVTLVVYLLNIVAGLVFAIFLICQVSPAIVLLSPLYSIAIADAIVFLCLECTHRYHPGYGQPHADSDVLVPSERVAVRFPAES